MIVVEKEMALVVREDDQLVCLVVRDPKTRKQVMYSCEELDMDAIQSTLKRVSGNEGLVSKVPTVGEN